LRGELQVEPTFIFFTGLVSQKKKFPTKTNHQVRISLLIFLVTMFYGTLFNQYS